MTVDLTDVLTDIAHTPAPPTSIDAARARVEGRRRLRRRRTAGAAGIVTVVVAGFTAAALVVTATPKAPAEPEADRATAAPVDPARSPLIAGARFGWLPSYITGLNYNKGFHGDTLRASGDSDFERQVFGAQIVLTVFKRGTTPELGEFSSGARQHRVPAAAVNKRPAYWVTADPADPLNGGDSYFRWQATSDRWAQIEAYYMPEASATQDVRRVAESAVVGEWAVPLPMYFTGLPDGFALDDVSLSRPSRDGKPWAVGFVYHLDPAPHTVSVSVVPSGPTPVVPRGPSGPFGAQRCASANGLDVCVTPASGIAPALAAIGGLDGLLSRITLIGMNEQEWTTDVMR